MNKALALAMTVAITTFSSYTAAKSSDDSVTSWGNWATLATAAGPQANINPFTLQFNAPENFTSAEQFDTTVEIPEERERFFGAMYDYQRKGKANNYRGLESFTYNLNPEDEAQGNFVMVDEDGSETTLSDWAQIKAMKGDRVRLFYEFKISCAEAKCNKNQRKRGYKKIIRPTMGEFTLLDKGDYQLGIAKLFTEESGKKRPFTRAAFVQGTATELNALQALAGITEARYQGSFAGREKAGVSLIVNFSDSSWSGKFNTKANQKMGTLVVTGGTIDGANLLADTSAITSSSRRMSITDGSVNASFFGDSAQAVAGIVDVSGDYQKNARSKVQSTRFTDVFDAKAVPVKTPVNR